MARLLTERDRARVDELLALDRVGSVYIGARVDEGVLAGRAHGELWGHPNESPDSLLLVGANLVPYRTDAAARTAFVGRLGPRRPCASIVGRTHEVVPLWQELGLRWGPAWQRSRAVRRAQPLMATDRVGDVAPDPRVSYATALHFDSYFEAAADMYTEELGEDPRLTNPIGYRHHMAELVENRRSFVIVEHDQVIFKADIGARAQGVGQIQGVWLRPDLRGRGLAAPAMAAVTALVLRDHDVASLYVNDFNAAAVATYARCGYQRVGQFTTVLY